MTNRSCDALPSRGPARGRGLRACLAAILCVVAAGCGPPGSHESPPPPIDRDALDAPGPAMLLPHATASITLEQLNASADAQLEAFREYRFSYGDTFTIVIGPAIAGFPETQATVLPDGHIIVLQRRVRAAGRTIDELVDAIVRGDPPLRPCPNCGHFYSPDTPVCPACDADADNVLLTARYVLAPGSIGKLAQIGGIGEHPSLAAIRRIAGTGHILIVCGKGLAVAELDGREATIGWTLPLQQVRIHGEFSGDAVDAAAEPTVSRELTVLQASGWKRIDLVTGETIGDAEAPDEVAAFDPPTAPTGLNAILADPQVQITNLQPSETAYAARVIGAVKSAGIVPVRPRSTMWDLFALSGGPIDPPTVAISGDSAAAGRSSRPPSDVNWKSAMLLRQARYLPVETLPASLTEDGRLIGRPDKLVRIPFDFEKLTDDASYDIPVFPGDLIYLPPYQPAPVEIIILGEAGNGIFSFDEEPSLIRALASAGWINEQRANGQVWLVRNTFADQADVYRVSPQAIVFGKARNLRLKDGDILYVDRDFLAQFSDVLSEISPIFPGLLQMAVQTRSNYDRLLAE
jgi:protein involved in polysaccharide export with SLBB domain